jgi:hypothetical protein
MGSMDLIRGSMSGTLKNRYKPSKNSIVNARSRTLFVDNSLSGSVHSSPTLNPSKSRSGSKIEGRRISLDVLVI